MSCHHCEGWGCTRCATQGEQGLTPVELELLQVREELRIARAEQLKAEVAAAEAQRAAAEMKAERDTALAQLALPGMEARA